MSAARLWQSFCEYWQAGGPLMLPLSAIVFLIWYRYLTLLLSIREALAFPETDQERIEQALRRDPGDPALVPWLRGLRGAVPRLTRHVLTCRRRGVALGEAFAQGRHAELDRYSHGCFMLGAFVVAAPLLGLLGTVLGMIETFNAVALRSGRTGEMIASGISQALITTQVGLTGALPGTFGLAHLYRLFKRLRHTIDHCESLYALVLRNGAGAPGGDGAA